MTVTPPSCPRPDSSEAVRTAASPPPDWLQRAWDGAKRRGLDTLTLDDINAEIDAYRREKESATRSEAG